MAGKRAATRKATIEPAGEPYSAGLEPKATHYKDTIRLPGGLSLDGAREVVERIRQYGWARPKDDFSIVEIEFEADDDWDLREQLAEIEVELQSYGVDFTVDKTKMTFAKPTIPADIREMLQRIEWVQQMNNSVAECPECGGIKPDAGEPIYENSFVGHRKTCALMAAIA